MGVGAASSASPVVVLELIYAEITHKCAIAFYEEGSVVEMVGISSRISKCTMFYGSKGLNRVTYFSHILEVLHERNCPCPGTVRYADLSSQMKFYSEGD